MKQYHLFMIILFVLLFVSYFIIKKSNNRKNNKNKNNNNKIFIVIAFIINAIYLIFRFTSIPINSGFISFVIGTLLFLAEFFGLFAFSIYVYIFTGKKSYNKKTLSDLDHIPTIDVFICTYNEDLLLLSKTITAATKLDYPKNKFKVYVLDDGNRAELKKMCNKYNVNYIAREKNVNAKAGNINNALTLTNGELFAVFDADMICKKNFLQNTVGYFADSNLAFVQTPQTYYNRDIYQYNVSNNFNNEQDFFMRYIENARDARKAVLHIGTNAIFRRTFVEEVGKYPTSSITEDMALGLLLQSKGYNSIFINECLACGLSAVTYTDLVKQRDRWCRGNLQVLHHFKKTILKKLNLGQKLIYLDGVLYWFTGIMKLIFIITPIIYLITGFVIVNLPPTFLLPLFVLAFTSQILLSKLILPQKISKHYFKFFIRGEIYNTIIAPHLAFSIIKHFFFNDKNFSVTSKRFSNFKGHFNLKLSFCHIILIIFSILSIIIGTINLNYDISYQSYFINLFAILYNMIGLIVSIKIAYQPPRILANELIPVKEHYKVIITSKRFSKKGFITELSEQYIKIQIPNYNNKLTINEKVKLKFNKLDINCTLNNIQNNELIFKYNNLTDEQLLYVINIILNNIEPYEKNIIQI